MLRTSSNGAVTTCLSILFLQMQLVLHPSCILMQAYITIVPSSFFLESGIGDLILCIVILGWKC